MVIGSKKEQNTAKISSALIKPNAAMTPISNQPCLEATNSKGMTHESHDPSPIPFGAIPHLNHS